MGLNNDDNSQDNRGSQLIEEQINTNKAELEAKRQNLYQTRMDIIKGQGAENWNAGSIAGGSSRAGGQPASKGRVF